MTDHRTTHGDSCICHSCAPANRWDIPACRGGNPGTPEREAYIARTSREPQRTLEERWLEVGSRRRAPYAGQHGHLS